MKFNYYKNGKLTRIDDKHLKEKNIETEGLLEIIENDEATIYKYVDHEDVYYKENGTPLFI